MIIPYIIYGIIYLFFLILLAKEKDYYTKKKANNPLACIIFSFVPTIGFGSILNLGIMGVVFRDAQKNAPIDELLDRYDFYFFNLIEKGGNMFQMYLEHPLAFLILAIVAVWGVRAILKTIFK